MTSLTDCKQPSLAGLLRALDAAREKCQLAVNAIAGNSYVCRASTSPPQTISISCSNPGGGEGIISHLLPVQKRPKEGKVIFMTTKSAAPALDAPMLSVCAYGNQRSRVWLCQSPSATAIDLSTSSFPFHWMTRDEGSKRARLSAASGLRPPGSTERCAHERDTYSFCRLLRSGSRAIACPITAASSNARSCFGIGAWNIDRPKWCRLGYEPRAPSNSSGNLASYSCFSKRGSSSTQGK